MPCYRFQIRVPGAWCWMEIVHISSQIVSTVNFNSTKHISWGMWTTWMHILVHRNGLLVLSEWLVLTVGSHLIPFASLDPHQDGIFQNQKCIWIVRMEPTAVLSILKLEREAWREIVFSRVASESLRGQSSTHRTELSIPVAAIQQAAPESCRTPQNSWGLLEERGNCNTSPFPMCEWKCLPLTQGAP